MPDEISGAQFQELIQVGVDTAPFAEGLKRMEEAYIEFMGRINAMGADSSGIFAAAGVVEGLQEVQAAMQDMRQVFAGQISAMAQTMTETFATAESQVEEATAQAKTHLVEIDGVMTEVTEREFLRLEKIARLNAQVKGQQAADEEKLARTVEVANQQMTAAFEKRAAAEAAGTEKLARMQEQANAQMTADFAARQAKQEAATQRMGVIQSKAAADNKRFTDEEIAANEKLARTIEVANAEMVKAIEKREAAQQAAVQRMGVIQSQALKDNEKFDSSRAGGGLSGMAASIGEMAVQLAAFLVIWKAVQAVIDVISTTIMVIPNAIKEGFEYLTQLDKAALELQAVLISNVRFSSDFATNLRLAADAAPKVQMALEDMAAKTGISVQTLNTAFKTFEEGGGQKMVSTLQDAVTVTGLLAQAMQTVTGPQQVQRKLAEELPKFLGQALGDTSKLGTALNMSKDEMAAMVKEAEKNGNLLQLLEPRLKPFLDLQQQALLHQYALHEALDLTIKRLEAIAAKPLWEQWTIALEKIIAFVKENEVQIKDFLFAAGQLAGDLLKFAIELMPLMKFVLFSLEQWIDSARLFIELIGLAKEAVKLLVEVIEHPWNLSAVSAQFDKLVDKAKEIADHFKEASDRYDRMNGHGTTEVDHPLEPGEAGFRATLAQTGVTGITNPRGKTPKDTSRRDLMADYREEVALIKKTHQEKIDDIKDEAAQKHISDVQAHREIADALEDEKRKLLELIKLYEEKAKKSVPKDQQNQVKKRLETEKTDTEKNEDKAIRGERRTADEEELSDEKRHAQAILRLERERLQQEIALLKQSGAAYNVDKSKILAKELELVKKEAKDEAAEYDRLIAKEAKGSAAQHKLEDDKARAAQASAAKIKLATNAVENAQKQELETSRKLTIEEQTNRVAALEAQVARLKQLHGATKDVKQAEAELAQAKVELVQATVNELEAEKAEIVAHGGNADAIQVEIDKLKELIKLKQEAAQDSTEGASGGGGFLEKIFGSGLTSLSKVFDDIKQGGDALSTAFSKLSSIVSSIQKGVKDGGVLGGIGAGMSAAAQFDPEPISKAILTIGGPILGFIGGMFKKAAKKIAESIQKAIGKIMDNLSLEQIDLKTAVSQLEHQREEAIRRLSGEKGGQDELNKLLPELDKQIAELKLQAKKIKEEFEQHLQVLELHSDVLGSVLQTWFDINKQVKDYIGAGGDAAKAAKFLSDNLRKLKEENQRELRDGEEQAIQDAIQLNELLQQRVKLVEDFKKQEFDLINGDAVERRQSGAVSRGRELAQLRAQFQKDLGDIDSQISLETKKLDINKQIFTISTDLAELHRRDEELQLQAIQEQVDAYRDMEKVVNSIVKGPDGLYKMTADSMKMIGALNGVVNPTAHPTQGGGSGHGLDDDDPRRRGISPRLLYGNVPVSPIAPITDSSFWNQWGATNAIPPPSSTFAGTGSTALSIGSVRIEVNTNQPVNGAQLYDELRTEIERQYRYGAQVLRR
jgi:hypothetical protein